VTLKIDTHGEFGNPRLLNPMNVFLETYEDKDKTKKTDEGPKEASGCRPIFLLSKEVFSAWNKKSDDNLACGVWLLDKTTWINKLQDYFNTYMQDYEEAKGEMTKCKGLQDDAETKVKSIRVDIKNKKIECEAKGGKLEAARTQYKVDLGFIVRIAARLTATCSASLKQWATDSEAKLKESAKKKKKKKKNVVPMR